MKTKTTEIIKKFTNSELNCFILMLVNSPSLKLANTMKTYFTSVSQDMYIEEDSSALVNIITALYKIILKSKGCTRDYIIEITSFKTELEQSIFNNLVQLEPYAPPYTKELLEFKLKTLETTITYAEVLLLTKDMNEYYTRIMTDDFNAWNDVNDTCTEISKRIKSHAVLLDDTKTLPNTITFDDPDYISVLTKKYVELENDPSSVVKTGIKMLNENMLGGGFKSDRLYVFLAPSKSGKSLLLQNACHWGIKYNNLTSKKGMRPVILYLSFENGSEDFMSRTITYGSGTTIDQLTEEQIQTIFKDNCYNPITGCTIQFEFRANESMSVADIDAYISELEAEDKDVVMLVVDYIGRVRPSDKKVDRRFQLSDISNELRNIATSRHIPVLSAAQTNRTANIDLDHAPTFEAKCEVAKHFGTSYIGDSIGIAQNCDFLISIARLKDIHINEETNTIEYTDDYWIFKSCLNRLGQDTVDYFFHRFENGAKPIEDVNEALSASVLSTTNMLETKLINTKIKTDPRSGRRIV